jgi:hypothetical protein
MSAWTRQLEAAIAEIVGRTRAELEQRISKLELQLQVEQRIGELERRLGISSTQIESVAHRLSEGLPVGAAEFLVATRRLQACDLGEWRPQHSSWRSGR